MGERVFQNQGFAGKRCLLSPPPPPSFHLFALAPFFTRPEYALPEFRSLRTGTLATQAKLAEISQISLSFAVPGGWVGGTISH